MLRGKPAPVAINDTKYFLQTGNHILYIRDLDFSFFRCYAELVYCSKTVLG